MKTEKELRATKSMYTVYYIAKACDFISKQLINKIALKQLNSCLRQCHHIRIDNKLPTIKQIEFSSIQLTNETKRFLNFIHIKTKK